MMPMKLMTAFSNLSKKQKRVTWPPCRNHSSPNLLVGGLDSPRPGGTPWGQSLNKVSLRYIHSTFSISQTISSKFGLLKFKHQKHMTQSQRTHKVKTQVWIHSQFGPVAGPGVRCKWYKISQNKPIFCSIFVFLCLIVKIRVPCSMM